MMLPYNDNLWFMASPLRPMDDETYEENLQKSFAYYTLLLRSGYRVIAPYLSLTRVLDDTIETQRALGMEIGWRVLRQCDGIISVGPRHSEGMQQEVLLALENELMWLDLVGTVSPCGLVCKKSSVIPISSTKISAWKTLMLGTWPDAAIFSYDEAPLPFAACHTGECALTDLQKGWSTK